MKRSYKYRIYPNIIQRETLDNIFNFCRFLYNSALEERISYYEKYKKNLSYNKQAASLKEIKNNFAESKIIYSQTLQQTLKQLDKSYSNFFRRVKEKANKVGFPRFKSKLRFKSICFPQVSDKLDSLGGVKRLPNNKLKVFGIPEDIKVKWHRPFQGRCKQAIISKSGKKYYLILSCDEVPLEPLSLTGKTIGIDLGITSFITQDDGTKFHHPRSYKTSKEKLAAINKKLALKQRGSFNRRRMLSALQKAYQKVSDIRSDYQHKLSKQLIRNNDVIIVEKLNIKSLIEKKTDSNSAIKQSITDASWGNFVAQLTYKAESAGRKIIQVNPRNTSKMCSFCSNIKNNLELKDRTYRCDQCSIEIDRDINAAINIKRLGMSLAAHP